ncbi:MAG: transcriptional repressor LexA [bacterium]
MNLTPKQQGILEFLQSYSQAKGYPPTQREIARRFRLKSLGSVQDYLQALERKGYLSKSAYGRRAIQLNDVHADAVRLPLLGTVAAGMPVEAIERQERIDVPKALLKGGENFVLLVRGDSMIEDGIHDGDLVIVRKQPTAQVGQTVVAMIDGEATVKKFYPGADRVELRPANCAMRSIWVGHGQGFQILGVVVGLMRRY